MMKKLASIFFLSLLLLNCEDVFHPENPSIANIENYDDLLFSVGGVYGKLANAFYPESGSGFYWVNLKGDDISSRQGSYDHYYSGGTCTPEYEIPDGPYMYEEQSDELWKDIYSTISSVNNILTQFPDLQQLDAPTRFVLGEIYLIRAYCHFRLTRCYGRIPLVINNDVSYTLKLAEYSEIYGQIESDLKTAASLLPIRASLAREPYNTPHRGSAKALLAEVYLNWAGYPAMNNEKYHEAAREAGEVIDSAAFFDLGLQADFVDVWKNDLLSNTENVFCLNYADPANASSTNEINNLYLGIIDHSYSPGFRTHSDSSAIRLDFFGCEINFYNNYPENYRKDNTFFTQIYVPGYYYDDNVDTGYIDIHTWTDCLRPCYRKFYLDAKGYSPDQFDSWWLSAYFYIGLNKVYLFRYAHTLLTYAEAKARAGEPDASAYEAVNQIRRRANNVDLFSPSVYDLSPGLSASEFADSVVWERAWELAGEPEGRWFDLLRLEMVEDLVQLRDPKEGGVPQYPITEDDYFFPIPEGDISLNPNLQN